ncbi:glycosyltransferase [Bradyrhizobium sp. WSM1253]|uniref:glycosyltransferase n=1 Tax=Bradyrhizobium sp. WSM1253 TaxID=319003 RepID=UPI00025D209F|nr:glycosyltransferase [Bradyrhizobium sp. WSM1253]EIG58456.1 glycosyltransferase [Bradyrhizobium sp. WSM1253]
MKILHIIPTADPRYGGPIEGIIRSSEVLSSLGHTRDLVTLDHPADPWLKGFPLVVFPLGQTRSELRATKKLFPWVRYGYAPRLVQWLRDNVQKYDVVLVSGLWNYATAAARRALPDLDVPYLVFTHGMLDPWFRRTYPIKTIAKQVSWWLVEGPLLANAHEVLFTCEEERILARNAFYPYRVQERVISYGTADAPSGASSQKAAFRQRVGSLGGRDFLLFLSRIHPKKGCDLLIDAFSEVASSAPELDLVIAGPGDPGLIERLKRRANELGIGDRIHWPGMLVGDEKWGAFRSCEAFVLPSHQENFGIVVAEALACGRPVLITNKVNIWREILAGKAGLVDNDDSDGVRSLLKRFISMSPEEKESLSTSARRTFLADFDISKNAIRLAEVLRKSAHQP